MSGDSVELPIRADWMYAVRVACQEFHNRALLLDDRLSVQEALTWLGGATPAARSIQEADALKNLLKDTAIDAGMRLHHAYHARIADSRCEGSPVEASAPVWSAHDADPRVVLGRWTRAFFAAFDSTHPMSMTERAMQVLRTRPERPPGLGELARLLGSSKSVVARALQRDLGMSRGEYVTRLRLRWFITESARAGANLTRLAEAAGYSSYHNLVGALRGRAGITPREILRLSDDQKAVIMDSKLAVGSSSLLEVALRSQKRGCSLRISAGGMSTGPAYRMLKV